MKSWPASNAERYNDARSPHLPALPDKKPHSRKHLSDTGHCGACKGDLPPQNEPLAADVALFDEVVQNSPVPVLVDFWAAWCGPCRMAAPEVAKTAASMAGRALVLKVDTEAHPQLSARYNVRGIPNFAVFRSGKLVQQQAGLVDSAQMNSWLSAAVTK